MKKKKGFTLIELLAVIVILAIIMLIATPIILNVIESSKKGSYIESVNGILDAAEKYAVMNVNGKETIDLTNESKLSYKGKKPEVGTLLINEEGYFSIIAKYENYCIEKKFSDNSPVIAERENCELADSEIIKYDNYIALNKSNNDCVTDSTKTCSIDEIIEGLEVSVNVNDTENYTFNVLKDNGDNLDLQINFNIGELDVWASNEDYKEATGNDCENVKGCNGAGPVTLLKNLKKLTDKWVNIDNQDGTILYKTNTIDMSNYKARLVTGGELGNLKCKWFKDDGSTVDSCPMWFGTEYFTMTPFPWEESNAITKNIVMFVYRRAMNSVYDNYNKYSYRPVITISKSMIK